MKKYVQLVCFGLLAALSAAPANAQLLTDREPAGYAQGSVAPLSANLPVLAPGRFWFETNLADNGFGYEGSYATLGGKTRLFSDYFDGRWLIEAQGNVSLQNGGFFGNLGIERVFTIDSAGVDASFGVWYDRDSDSYSGFSHTFDQVGVSAALKGRRGDLRMNGYFPIGDTDRTLGDPTGVNCFLNHSIVLQAGIDSALRGFDVELSTRPSQLAAWNGFVDIGGYSYESDLVESFSGIRTRLGLQAFRGTMWSVEANYDERFDFTGVMQLAFFYQGRGAGNEYAGTGRDLESTVRRDHIARFNQDLVLAVNPATGAPYNVYHVDNTALAGGDGTFESAFDTLRGAELASANNDIIFVNEGDGTVTGMDQGITLKDGQFLLGNNVAHTLIDANRGSFLLCNDIGGTVPRITNRNGNGIDLANQNTVRGFIIDGAGSNMVNAISGQGIQNAIIEDVTVRGNPILDAINISNSTGAFRFARNDIQTAGRDGIAINNLTGVDSTLNFNNNTINNNTRDGIHITNYDGSSFRFFNNNTNLNGRHGIFMDSYASVGGDFDFIQSNAIGNVGDGIFLSNADGDLLFADSNIQNNNGFGIHLVDFTNTQPGDLTTITTVTGNSIVSGNGLGSTAGVGVFLNAGNQRLRISNTTLDNNGIGVLARANNFGTVLDSQITDNISIDNNVNDGVRFVSAAGAVHTSVLTNVGAALSISGNGGNGVTLLAEDGGVNASVLTSTIDNVNIVGSGGNGIFGFIEQNAQLTARNTNTSIIGSGGDGIFVRSTSNNPLLNTVFNENVVITGSGGNGAQFDLDNTSQLDIQFLSSTIAGSGADGININAAGNGIVADTDDTITRLFTQNTQITGNGDEGVDFLASEDSINLIEMRSTAVTGNAGNGIQLVASEQSIMSVRLPNNTATGNAGIDTVINTLGTAQIDALVTDNAFGTFAATNDTLSRVCLALSTNLFGTPAVLTNNGAPADFVVELDGNSNGFGTIQFNPNQAAFTLSPFGSTCEPNIIAQEAVFSGLGFPPLN